jgi:hypothetical protein
LLAFACLAARGGLACLAGLAGPLLAPATKRQLICSTFKDEEEVSDEPVKVTPRRRKLAFRRANSYGPEKLAA